MQETKSYEDWFLGLYKVMFSDITRCIPSLQKECERDYKRLLSCVEHHGIPFILDTLVAYLKHFDRCLDQRCLTRSRLPHFRGYKRGSPVPRLFKGLMLRIFDINGELRPVPDVESIRFLRQLMGSLKSFKIDCPNSRIYENVREFFETDDAVRLPSLSWNGDCPDFSSACDLEFSDLVLHESNHAEPEFLVQQDCVPSISRDEYDVVQRTADIFASTLGRFDPAEWRARHGPGAVSDLRGSCINKYRFPSWSDRLETVFPMADFAYANYDLWIDSLQHEDWQNECKTDIEPVSRLLTVPKTYRAPRLIASEPTAHQWCQQVVRDFLMSRIECTAFARAVSFRDQTANQSFALGASHSRSHATIDLSAASDRISCWVIERLFRRSPTLLRALHACRTRWITQDLDKKTPFSKELRKFSTMGSAVTFPVQTILFTTVAVSAVLISRKVRPTIRAIRKIAKEVQVFGDDIIVPIDSWDVTQSLLTAFGLKVNTDKTFGNGNFRESCGMDAYDGHNVSKVSILAMPVVAKPEKVLSTVDVHNNLLMGGWFCTADFVRKAVSRMRNYAFPEVAPFSGVTGWFTFGEADNSYLPSRWNDKLHRREYRVTQPSARVVRIQSGDVSSYLQYFVEAAHAPSVEGDRIGHVQKRIPLRLRKVWAPLPV